MASTFMLSLATLLGDFLLLLDLTLSIETNIRLWLLNRVIPIKVELAGVVHHDVKEVYLLFIFDIVVISYL